MIRCPTCGNDLVYSPIPALYLCLEGMTGDIINIRTQCKPWIAKDAPAEDLIALTDRISKLAPELDLSKLGKKPPIHPPREGKSCFFGPIDTPI
jgi:hypothetical protein